MIIFAVLACLMVLWYYYRWTRKNFYRLAAKLRGPSTYEIGRLLLGSHEKRVEKVIEISKNYGPEPYKIWLGPILNIVVTKPEDIQIVLNSSMALQKNIIYDFFKDIVGESIFTAPVDKWRRNRRHIAPIFNSNQMKLFFPIFIKKNQILIRNLKNEIGKTEPFDLWHYIEPASLDMICQTAMGYNLDTQSKSESKFAAALMQAFGLEIIRLGRPWLYPKILFSMYLRLTGQQKFFETIRELPNQIIKEKKRILSQRKIDNKENSMDITNEEEKSLKMFLDTLLELNEVEMNFSDEEIRDEVLNMMFAGSDTNAVAVCSCLLLLAIHTDIQDKVYGEIYEVFGDGDQIITIEDAAKLVYLEQVLKETLRLYPIVPLIFRELQDDIEIASGNHILPKGTSCIVSVIGNHRMPELYPNPLDFNPDNFNPENVAKRHKCSFIAFSGGPRGCLGSKYAMLLMKVIVSTFLRNFSIHTELKLSDIKLRIELIMRSACGYPVKIRPRNKIFK